MIRSSHIHTFSFFILLSLFSVAHGEVELSPQPDWIEKRPTIEAQTIDPKRNSYSHSVLLLDSQVRLMDKVQHSYNRIASQVRNHNGLKELGKVQITYDPIYEKLTVHGVSIIRKDQSINVLQNSQFEIIQQETDLHNEQYNGNETALLIVKDLREGDVLDYDYTITGSNPIFRGKFFRIFSANWHIPIEDLYITLTLPESMNVVYKNHASQAKPKIKTRKNNTHYDWHMTQVEAVNFLGNYPKGYTPFGFIQVTEFADWLAVSQWATDVFSVDQSVNDELDQLIKSWDSLNNPTDKASAALSYVQNKIRYFGLELGVNSHEPHLPIETFNSRFGDCKDKTILLHTMLNRMGIESQPALVSTEFSHQLDTLLPSPGVFNHVILKVMIDDNIYWVDPTINNQSHSFLYNSVPDLGFALPINKQQAQLESIEIPAKTAEKKFFIDKISPNEKGLYDLAVTTILNGSFAEQWRHAFKEKPASEFAKDFEAYINKLYGAAKSTNPFKFDDDLNKNALTQHEHYELSELWVTEGNYQFFDLVAYGIVNYTDQPQRIYRDVPLGLNYPLSVSHKITLNEADLTIEEQDITISNKYFNFDKKISKNSEGTDFLFSFKTLSPNVPLKDLHNYLQDLKKVKDAIQVRVVKPVAFKKELKKREDKLKLLLKKMMDEKNEKQ